MGHGLYTLCNDLVPKRPRQANRPFQDGQVVEVGQHVVHKTLVNFQQLDLQAFQVVKRRIGHANVVQGKRHLHVAAEFNNQ